MVLPHLSAVKSGGRLLNRATLDQRLRKGLKRALDYVPAALGGLSHPGTFDSVERFCLFIGYPRSGHSLVGSLLDGHPKVVLAHELDALKYVAAGYRRRQLYWMILQRDTEFTRSGRRWTEFEYSVPGPWQGRHQRLRIIGDKKGGSSTFRLGRNPELLDWLRRVADSEVRLVHVVRNPFDNIATMSRRSHRSLKEASDQYFGLCRIVRKIVVDEARESVIDIQHERLIRNPKASLLSLCSDLGLGGSEEYLDAGASVVAPSPHLSRCEAPWTDELIASVEEA